MTYVCPVDWCTVDHTHALDDLDLKGSRFHYSDDAAVLDQSRSDTHWWTVPERFAVQWVCLEQAGQLGEVRADVNQQYSLTAEELERLGSWLLDRAAEVRGLNASA